MIFTFSTLAVGANQWHWRREGDSDDIVSVDNDQLGSITFDTACFVAFQHKPSDGGWVYLIGSGPIVFGPDAG